MDNGGIARCPSPTTTWGPCVPGPEKSRSVPSDPSRRSKSKAGTSSSSTARNYRCLRRGSFFRAFSPTKVWTMTTLG